LFEVDRLRNDPEDYAALVKRGWIAFAIIVL
jgi:hypothetical protein